MKARIVIVLLFLLPSAACPQSLWTQYQINGGFSPKAALFTHPLEPGALYATSLGQVNVSRDGGITWETLSHANLYTWYVDELTFDISDRNHFFVSTADRGILNTLNHGYTFAWANAGLGISDSTTQVSGYGSIAQNPYDANEFLVAGNGISRSTDKGEHWIRIRDGHFFTSVLYDVSAQDRIYASFLDQSGIFIHISTDNGLSWEVTSMNGGGYVPLVQLPDGILFAGSYISRDRGATWLKTEPAISASQDYYKGEEIFQFSYDPETEYLYAVDDYDGMIKIRRGSRQWELTPFSANRTKLAPRTRSQATSVAVDTLNNRIFVISSDSLYVSEKGGEFHPVETRLYFPIVNQIAFKGPDTMLAGVPRTGRSAVSYDRGKHWEDMGWYHNFRSAAYLPFDDFLLVQQWYSIFLYSIDHGSNFVFATNIAPDFNECMKINPLEPEKIFGGGGYGLFMTSKKILLEDTTHLYPFTTLSARVVSGFVEDFVFHPTDSNSYYILSYEGSSASNLYFTSDKGANWRALTKNTTMDSAYRAISLDPSDPNRIYIATDWGIIYTHDGGLIWNKGKGPMPNGSFGQSEWFSGILVDPRKTSIIYAAARTIPRQHPPESNCSGGMYRSSDYGETWQAMSVEGLMNLGIQRLQYADNPPRLIACTMGGAYEYILPDIVEVERPAETPARFSLSLYPNPVRQGSTATMAYELPERAHAEIAIFDLLGRRVATPVSGTMDRGKGEVRFSTGSLKTGIYFIRFRAGKGFRSGKLIVKSMNNE